MTQDLELKDDSSETPGTALTQTVTDNVDDILTELSVRNQETGQKAADTINLPFLTQRRPDGWYIVDGLNVALAKIVAPDIIADQIVSLFASAPWALIAINRMLQEPEAPPSAARRVEMHLARDIALGGPIPRGALPVEARS